MFFLHSLGVIPQVFGCLGKGPAEYITARSAISGFLLLPAVTV
jgi:hypothetical protein